VNQNQLHLALFLSEEDGYMLCVKRGEYICFLGDIVREHEDIADCARRVLSQTSIVMSLETPIQLLGGVCEWEGKQTLFDIYSLGQSEIVTLSHPDALYVRLTDDMPFDIFIETFKRAPRKIVTPREETEKQLAA
jgi:hypothetical protein